MSALRLSVLDQSPIPSGSDARTALENTVDLARWAEHLGYTRYWLAEHHGAGGFAGSVPEILIGAVASATTTIRVGSGGVMLPHYSPLKVAEAFGLLETLYPGRIDCGLGRAPGSDGITSVALRRNRRAPVGDDFAEQIAELVAWFDQAFPPGHPFASVVATPTPLSPPEMWLLTSSGWSAHAAAALGCGVAFAHFIAPERGPEAMAQYRTHFTPRHDGDLPRAAVAVGVVCAESDDAAEELALSVRLWRHRSLTLGMRGPIPSVTEALADPYREVEHGVPGSLPRMIVGSPARVAGRLVDLADQYGVDEVIVVTITHDHEARRASYALLAAEFGLVPNEADGGERRGRRIAPVGTPGT